jgi:hypothetical protein
MKGAKPKVVQQTLDPATQSYLSQLRSRAMGMQPYNAAAPSLNQASGLLGQYGQQGLLGLQAQTNPAAAQQYMNPYLAALDPTFAKLRAQAGMGADQTATQAGAFGGSRADVLKGTELGNIDQLQAQTNYGAYNDAMNRAMQSANLGMGASGQLGQIGQFLTQLPVEQQGQIIQLLLGAIGPSQTTTTQPTQKNLLGDAGGGAAIGSKFGPVGAAIGGGIGLLGGLLGG